MSFTEQLRLAAVLGCLCLAGGRAEAGLVMDNVHAVYDYPTQSTLYADGGVKAVNPTATFVFPTVDKLSLTVANATITAAFSDTSYFTGGDFNGFTISDVTRDPSITGFTATSNLVGFTSSDVTFTSNSVTVNLQGLSFTPSSTLEIDLQFSSAVPEPSSFALCGVAGVAGLAVARLRRRLGVA